MKIELLLVFICSFVSLNLIQAQAEKKVDDEVIEMNDISFTEYGDFTKTWKLVTVRFRQDTHEQRFTYANEKAWQALEKGKTDYPDGAVFAKVGYKSGVDPLFNSSIVPSGARRFQYMVKDSKKYKDTNGWGYAVFKSDGELFDGEINVQTQACHVCHTIVKDKGYVFSEPIETSPFVTQVRATYSLDKAQDKIQFMTLKTVDTEGFLNKTLKNQKIKELQIVAGAMREYFFGGTLDEITPILIHQAIKIKKPTAFVSHDLKTFKVVRLRSSSDCGLNQVGIDVFEYRTEWTDQKTVNSKLCYDSTLVK